MTNKNKQNKRMTTITRENAGDLSSRNKLEFSTAYKMEIRTKDGLGTCRVENALLYQILKMKANISSLRFVEMMIYQPHLDKYILHFACMYKQKGEFYTESRSNGQHYKMLWARWCILKKMNVLKEIKPKLMKCAGIDMLVDNAPFYKTLRGVWVGEGNCGEDEDVIKTII